MCNSVWDIKCALEILYERAIYVYMGMNGIIQPSSHPDTMDESTMRYYVEALHVFVHTRCLVRIVIAVLIVQLNCSQRTVNQRHSKMVKKNKYLNSSHCCARIIGLFTVPAIRT